jgi:hypothetical protein
MNYEATIYIGPEAIQNIDCGTNRRKAIGKALVVRNQLGCKHAMWVHSTESGAKYQFWIDRGQDYVKEGK